MTGSFSSEPKLPLSAVKKQHPSLTNVSLRSLARWARLVTRGARLESVRIGGRLMTSLEAVDRFISATSQTDQTVTPQRSPAERRRASEQAAGELAAAGA